MFLMERLQKFSMLLASPLYKSKGRHYMFLSYLSFDITDTEPKADKE